jgi:type VI secretion system protein ImpJ
MARNRKVLWYEGMTLDPHHFQHWDRYNQALLNFRVPKL